MGGTSQTLGKAYDFKLAFVSTYPTMSSIVNNGTYEYTSTINNSSFYIQQIEDATYLSRASYMTISLNEVEMEERNVMSNMLNK